MTAKALFAKYLTELSAVAQQGDAREESFYPALADIRTYCRIVTALGLTICIQEQIDALYPGVEKETVAVNDE